MVLRDYLINKQDIAKKGIYIVRSKNEENFLSYSELFQKANSLLMHLIEKKVGKGCILCLQFTNEQKLIVSFWACQMGGIIPVIIPENMKDLGKYTGNRDTYYYLTDNEALINKNHDYFKNIIKYEEDNLDNGDAQEIYTNIEIGSSHPAMIQFSSGSTSDPKGVILTNQNVVSEYSAMMEQYKYFDTDVFLSWLPLTHNFGLIFHLIPLMYGVSQVLIPPKSLMKDISLWPVAIQKYRATATSSNNEMLYNLVSFAQNFRINNWNLSSIRMLFVGGGQVNDQICENFIETFNPMGFKANTLAPGYGLTETTLTVASKEFNKKTYSKLNIKKSALTIGNKVQITNRESEMNKRIVSSGPIFSNIRVRIINGKHGTLPNNYVGYIEVKGASVTPGYFENEEKTKDLFDEEGWLKTGDIGFLYKNELYVIGRSKDMFIINGLNYYFNDIEDELQKKLKMPLKNIVITIIENENSTFKILCFLKVKNMHNSIDSLGLESLCNDANHQLVISLGLEIEEFIFVDGFPLSTIGKVQRFKLNKEFNNNSFARTYIPKKGTVNGKSAKKYSEKEVEAIISDLIYKYLNRYIEPDESIFEAFPNSLLLTKVYSEIENFVKKNNEDAADHMSIADIFQYTTLSELTNHVYEILKDGGE